MADDKQQRTQQLKEKYGSVLRVIEQQGVRLKNANVENNKLLIRGAAPSEDAKNKVWDQIKLVDPSYSDLTCDLRVEQRAGHHDLFAIFQRHLARYQAGVLTNL